MPTCVREDEIVIGVRWIVSYANLRLKVGLFSMIVYYNVFMKWLAWLVTLILQVSMKL